MSLHNDFPYAEKKLYCKTCKGTTLHTESFTDFKCETCGMKWDELLIRVDVKQSPYGKMRYEGTVISEKPANSRDYTSKTFDSLKLCIKWLNQQVEILKKEIL